MGLATHILHGGDALDSGPIGHVFPLNATPQSAAAEFLHDLVLRRVFVLKHISGVSNPADIMTKPLPRGTFVLIIDLIDNFVDTVND